MKLKKYKLGDIGEIRMCKRILKSQTTTKGDIPFYKIGTFGKEADTFISRKIFNSYKERYNFPNKGDVLISAAGTIGRCVIYNGEDSYYQDSNIVWVNNDESIVLNDYLFYVLNNITWIPSKGSTILRLYNDDIRNKDFIVPNLEYQRVIADTLKAIDKKIKLNRQINDNLEAMAKQLYDYWFVQFDFPNEEGKPYKSSGGALVYNEELKREIPQGWHCYELNKWLEIKSGFAFKSETYISKGKFKVVTIKNVQDHHLDTSSCDYVYEIPQGMKEWCSLSVNDRLISLTGNCGRLCIVTENDLLLNQRVGLLACNDEYIDYAYLLLSSEEYQTLSNNLAKGAAQANLSPVDLCKNIAVLPKLDVLEKFNRQIKPIVASYIQNEIQIAELTKQRDELLPLLMNGQASVNYHLSDD